MIIIKFYHTRCLFYPNIMKYILRKEYYEKNIFDKKLFDIRRNINNFSIN